jgi:hypothetical protein
MLPVVAGLASRHPERTVFTRFLPPQRPEQMPGKWQRYYRRWRSATRECLNPRSSWMFRTFSRTPLAPSALSNRWAPYFSSSLLFRGCE